MNDLPSDVRVALPDAGFEDVRGRIQNLLLRPITSVARITSKKGTVRANHYHKTDWHYAFVESGAIEYHEVKLNDHMDIDLAVIEACLEAKSLQSRGSVSLFRAGDMFFSGPMVVHAMVFVEDTVFYTFAQNVRSHENHESDVVRVELVSPDEVARLYG